VAWISYLRWVVLWTVLCRAGCRSCWGPTRIRPWSTTGPRGRACRRPRDRPAVGTGSVAPRDSAPPPAGRRTANGSRPRAPWARLTTIPACRRPVKAGSATAGGRGRALSTGVREAQRRRRPGLFPAVVPPAARGRGGWSRQTV